MEDLDSRHNQTNAFEPLSKDLAPADWFIGGRERNQTRSESAHKTIKLGLSCMQSSMKDSRRIHGMSRL